MQIEIKNFGPIDNLTFDLDKDIHLIYGQNSIGKSYAIYAVYLLLKNITKEYEKTPIVSSSDTMFSSMGPLYTYKVGNFTEEISEIFNSKLKSLSENQTLDIIEDYNLVFEIALYKTFFGSALKNSFLTTFSSISGLHNKYVNKKFEIILHNSKDFNFKIVSNNENDIKIIYQHRFTKFSIKKESGKYKMFNDDTPPFQEFTLNEVLNQITFLISRELQGVISDVTKNLRFLLYFLPADRSGLYVGLNAISPIIGEISRHRYLLKNPKIDLPTLSEPISDYYLDISTVDKNKVNAEFQEAVDFLQKEVLKGEVDYDQKSKKIYYSPDDLDIKLELSNSSSMIAEVSPLVIYLKHIVNNKFDLEKGYSQVNNWSQNYLHIPSILFIEEPEAHLHPEVQVKLMELFSKLPKYGIKVFITSHSNYMFNKLNNMLIKKEVDDEKIAVYHLVKTSTGTIDKKDMKVTEDGVNDENFQEVTEQLYYERLNYLENNGDTKD